MTDRRLEEILSKKLPETQHDKIEAYSESTYYWARRNDISMRTWAQETQEFLKQNEESIDVRKFMTNLFGLVEDTHKHLLTKVNSLKKIYEATSIAHLKAEMSKSSQEPSMLRYCLSMVDAHEVVDKIRSSFSEDDLFKLGFFRHVGAHPILSGYATKLSQYSIENVEKYQKFMKMIGTDQQGALLTCFEELYPKLKLNAGHLVTLDGKFLQMTV
jgi:hypothetical protein